MRGHGINSLPVLILQVRYTLGSLLSDPYGVAAEML